MSDLRYTSVPSQTQGQQGDHHRYAVCIRHNLAACVVATVCTDNHCMCVVNATCRIADNATDASNAPPTVTLAQILQGQPERPAPTQPTGPTPSAASGGASGPPLLQVVLPVVLGAAVLAAVGLVGFKLFKFRRAGRVVASPEPGAAQGLGARGMLGELRG